MNISQIFLDNECIHILVMRTKKMQENENKNNIHERGRPDYELRKNNPSITRKFQSTKYFLFIIIFGLILFSFFNSNQKYISSEKDLQKQAKQLEQEKEDLVQEKKDFQNRIKNMESVLNNKDVQTSLVKGKLILPPDITITSDYKICAQKVEIKPNDPPKTNPYYLLICRKMLGNQKDFKMYLTPGDYYIYADLSNSLPSQSSSEFKTLYYSESSTSAGIEEGLSNDAKKLSISKDNKEINDVFLSNFKTCNSESKFPYCILNNK